MSLFLITLLFTFNFSSPAFAEYSTVNGKIDVVRSLDFGTEFPGSPAIAPIPPADHPNAAKIQFSGFGGARVSIKLLSETSTLIKLDSTGNPSPEADGNQKLVIFPNADEGNFPTDDAGNFTSYVGGMLPAIAGSQDAGVYRGEIKIRAYITNLNHLRTLDLVIPVTLRVLQDLRLSTIRDFRLEKVIPGQSSQIIRTDSPDAGELRVSGMPGMVFESMADSQELTLVKLDQNGNPIKHPHSLQQLVIRSITVSPDRGLFDYSGSSTIKVGGKLDSVSSFQEFGRYSAFLVVNTRFRDFSGTRASTFMKFIVNIEPPIH